MKKLLFIVITTALIAAGIYDFLSLRGLSVKISNEQIKSQLNDNFPFNKKYFVIFDLNLDNPNVILQAESKKVKVALDIKLKVTITGKEYDGKVEFLTGINYKKEKGQFFLKNCKLLTLKIDGLPEKYSSQISKSFNNYGKEVLNNYPVYSLESKDLKIKISKMILDDVIIEDEELIIKFKL